MNDVASGWKFEPYRGRMRIAAVAAALVALFAPVVRLVEQVSKPRSTDGLGGVI